LNRVLIVDDNAALTEPLAHHLGREGFEPTIVGDGASALAEFDPRHVLTVRGFGFKFEG
jgi:two-component system response regulator RegX3